MYSTEIYTTAGFAYSTTSAISGRPVGGVLSGVTVATADGVGDDVTVSDGGAGVSAGGLAHAPVIASITSMRNNGRILSLIMPEHP